MDFERVLDEWFGPVFSRGDFDPEKAERWWTRDANFDIYLREHYREQVERALSGQLDDWLTTPRGTLAGVLLLDQLTRNIFRGTPRMYAGDELARRWSEHATKQRFDEQLPLIQRLFLYMPLMHSEQLSDQSECVRLVQRLAQDASDIPGRQPLENALASSLDYAKAHRDIVERFGRFPHRNAILGRPSTPDELEFLKQPGSSF